MLEVCIDSLESAVNAIKGGADELELCSALTDGGLTPSAGLVKEVIKLVNNQSSKKTKVNVMLRCRGGDDFNYSDFEMVTMISDLQIFKEMGVDRFVFGALTNTQEIDEEKCMKIVKQAYPEPVTFHRAFDLCKNPLSSIEIVVKLGFDRLLTSGQSCTADNLDAIKLIKELLEKYGNKIVIMPGAGISAKNAKTFIDLGCTIVHSSCKKVVYLPKVDSKLTLGESNKMFITNENIVRDVIKLIR